MSYTQEPSMGEVVVGVEPPGLDIMHVCVHGPILLLGNDDRTSKVDANMAKLLTHQSVAA
jgi:hypothetical protein